MKKITILFTLLFSSSVLFAQTPDSLKHWTKGGVGSLNFTQTSFTNWAAGGQNAVSATALLNLFSNYKKNKTSWDNTLDLAYGLLQSGTTKFRKNEDRIDFSSKFGHYAFKERWYYSALLNFKSQFDNGYNFPNDTVVVSHFLAPAYVLASIGLDYKTKDNSLSIFISPITSRTTIVGNQRLADAGAFGVTAAKLEINGTDTIYKPGEKVLNQFGGYVKFAFKKDIFKNVNYSTKLELFSNYLKNPENIIVYWENLLAMKVNKFLSASISTNMIYDHNIPVPVKETINGAEVSRTGPRLQFKQVLAIGLSYKF
jgi:Protein of unknown function (DUF3078)